MLKHKMNKLELVEFVLYGFKQNIEMGKNKSIIK